MNMTKIYDVPTRLFHWLFAAAFAGAYFIAQVLDDDSSYYPYHMMLGLMMVLMVGLRVLWGIFGSRYAQFSSFPLKPSSAIKYFKDLLFLKTERSPGHNPASAWAAVIMMGLTLGLGVTGYRMTHGANSEFYEETHELLANAFIFVAIAHVMGVFLHNFRHRDGIVMTMFHGRKKFFESSMGIQKSHAAVGFLFLIMIAMFGAHLRRQYDPSTRTMKVWGSTFQMGESEEEDQNGNRDEEEGDD